MDNVDSPYAGIVTLAKKRKMSRNPPAPGSPNDSDFAVEGASEVDDEFPAGELASDDEELFYPACTERGRAAAHQARQAIHDLTHETQRKITALKRKRSVHSSRAATPLAAQSTPTADPVAVRLVPLDLAVYGARRLPLSVVNEQILSTARAYDSNAKPVFLSPPNIGGTRNYVSIDESNVRLYAAEGCTTEEELWATALSYKRFSGPRRHPPFRELHRLVGPEPHDDSEFAENIRWAKQQYLVYGSSTWREYDHDLETIAQHRRQVLWVSEEKILYGK